MLDTLPARSLVETVAAKYAEFLECAAARDLKASLCMDDGACSCRRDVAFIASAFLDAIAEPSDAMGRAGLIATNGDSLEGWPDEHRRAALEALGDIGLSDRITGNPSKWMKPVWRAMFSVLRKEVESG